MNKSGRDGDMKLEWQAITFYCSSLSSLISVLHFIRQSEGTRHHTGILQMMTLFNELAFFTFHFLLMLVCCLAARWVKRERTFLFKAFKVSDRIKKVFIFIPFGILFIFLLNCVRSPADFCLNTTKSAWLQSPSN